MRSIVGIFIAIAAFGSAQSIPVRRLPFLTYVPHFTSSVVNAATNTSISILQDFAHSAALSPISSHKNVFFSPLGVANTLAMMRLCSSGNTRDEFDQLPLFRLPGGVSASFNFLNHFLLHSSSRHFQPPQTDLDISNLIFIDKQLDYTDEFINRAVSFYYMDVLQANFSTDSMTSLMEMNNIISAKTRGLIPNMFSSADINSETQLVISNTIYFKGLWKRSFMRASEPVEIFHLRDGNSVPVTMMTRTYYYANHILCTAESNNTNCGNSSIPDLIEIPFKGDNRKMVIVLPNRKVSSLDEIKRRFATEIGKWRGAARKTYVTLTMPKFTLDYEVNLKDVLANQGLQNVFDSSTANFKDLSSRPLQLTKFVHKTSISVGQNGVTLAAGSGVIGMIRIAHSEFAQNSMVVNRPFLFFIEDSPSKMMIFLGEVTDPR